LLGAMVRPPRLLPCRMISYPCDVRNRSYGYPGRSAPSADRADSASDGDRTRPAATARRTSSGSKTALSRRNIEAQQAVMAGKHGEGRKRVLEASDPREFQELARQHRLPTMSSWEDSPGADGLISCKAHPPLAQRWARGRGSRVQRRDDTALRRMAYRMLTAWSSPKGDSSPPQRCSPSCHGKATAIAASRNRRTPRARARAWRPWKKGVKRCTSRV
jgi:hypothetical protein